MAAGAEVSGGMAAGRVVATTHMTATLTHAEVYPIVAPEGEAVFATGGGRSDGGDLIEMGA
jgi:hypothetical protein